MGNKNIALPIDRLLIHFLITDIRTTGWSFGER